MVDKISVAMRSKVMASIKSTNTAPEVAISHALSRLGYKYKKNYGIYNIDIAFPGKKIGIFIDGCYWHCCPLHGHMPKSNIKYWGPKLKRNKDRDLKVNAALKANDWTIIRIWEHDITRHLNHSISKIINRLAKNGVTPNSI